MGPPNNWRQLGGPPPLTPEYQKVWEASQADVATGKPGNWPSTYCLPEGMPAMMNVYNPFEIIIKPDTTYILTSHNNDIYRRIYTDGRDWPANPERTLEGYSIGRWVDEDGSGRFNVLEVETRGFKGPRAYDATGLPLAFDNQSVFQERFYLDKNDSSILHDVITVSDHALTRPWTVDKRYRRNPNPRPAWREDYCIEGNSDIVVGKEHYFLSADGYLMPVKKNQPPPDLRYFKPSQK
jgi:hypothetical protein